MYKIFYIGLVDINNPEEGYNIIIKTGKNYYWGDYGIAIKKHNNNNMNKCNKIITKLSKNAREINTKIRNIRIKWK